MAALDFPSSPSVGTIYPNPAVAGQPVYTWDGEKWTSGTGAGAIYIADSAPAAPTGSLWWESDTGILYVRYNDGDSTQWVAIAGGIADAVRYGGPQGLNSGQRSQARANIDVTKKNYIINGAMMVSQENGTTAGAASGYFPVDQFSANNVSSAAIGSSQAATSTPAGSPNRLQFYCSPTADTSVAAGDVVWIEHKIEGLRVADLMFGTAAAKTITVQFGVKAPAGTYSFTLANGTPNRSYVSEYVIAAGEANTNVVKSITIPGDTSGTWAKDNTAGFRLYWGLMGGTTYQQAAGNWGAGGLVSPNQFNFVGTVGNIFELFDVGLYEGTVAPPFMVPDYASELAACMRYYQIAQLSLDVNAAAGVVIQHTIALNPNMRAATTLTLGSTNFAPSNLTTPTLTGNGTNSTVAMAIQASLVGAGRGYYYGRAIFNARL